MLGLNRRGSLRQAQGKKTPPYKNLSSGSIGLQLRVDKQKDFSDFGSGGLLGIWVVILFRCCAFFNRKLGQSFFFEVAGRHYFEQEVEFFVEVVE